MPWCPVCKNEYVEGKTHCPDCDVDLVESLTEEIAETEENVSEMRLPTEEEIKEYQEIMARRAATAHMNTYTSAKSRHAETKSSAWTFLFLGAVGFVIMTLALIGVIHIPLHTFALVVMEAMFIGFLFVSVISFKNVKKLQAEITDEADLEARVMSWAKENLIVDELTADLDADTADEMKYFMVSELIREKIMTAFPEVDDSYAEELTENFYNELFS